MAKMHEQDLANIQQKKNEEGDARTESGGPISEGDYEKDNPKDVQTAAMVVNAELRRDQWIRHQVEEYKSQPELDCVFRKGVDRGVNVNHHNYRIQSPRKKTDFNASFTYSRTPARIDDMVKLAASG